jgi:hypothetical protein
MAKAESQKRPVVIWLLSESQRRVFPGIRDSARLPGITYRVAVDSNLVCLGEKQKKYGRNQNGPADSAMIEESGKISGQQSTRGLHRGVSLEHFRTEF